MWKCQHCGCPIEEDGQICPCLEGAACEPLEMTLIVDKECGESIPVGTQEDITILGLVLKDAFIVNRIATDRGDYELRVIYREAVKVAGVEV